jgi:hypothetical protein
MYTTPILIIYAHPPSCTAREVVGKPYALESGKRWNANYLETKYKRKGGSVFLYLFSMGSPHGYGAY